MVKHKKGSVTLFLVIFLTGMVYMLGAFIGAAREKAIEGAVDSLGTLWASSLLGEYDRKLLADYHIFAFYGTEVEEAEKVDILADYSFDEKEYIQVDNLQVDFIGYNLITLENFRSQIREGGMGEVMQGATIMEDTFDVAQSAEEGDSPLGREISNERILRSLPSYGRVNDSILDRAGELVKDLGDPKALIREGTDNYFINKYIAGHFGNLVNDKWIDGHYFKCEEEYILCGKSSDEDNRKAVRNRIILMREIMNMIYIEQDPEMSALALAVGEVITAGMGGTAAQQAVMAAWSLAESINDYRLLIHGKKVPFIKSETSWATNLESLIDNWEGEYIDTDSGEGNTYEDYLSVLLYIMGEDARLLRIMDLIQINMQYSYNEDFILEDYYVGLRITMEVNGRIYRWNDEY